MGVRGSDGGTKGDSNPKIVISAFLQGLVLITFLYLLLVSFVKPLNKSCKARLFSGYFHPSPIIDQSRGCFAIPWVSSLSPAFVLSCKAQHQAGVECGAHPLPCSQPPRPFKQSPLQPVACTLWVCAPGVCFRDFLLWGFTDLKQIP